MSVHVYMARLQAYIRAEDWDKAAMAAWRVWRETYELAERNMNISTAPPVDVDARTTVCQPTPPALYKGRARGTRNSIPGERIAPSLTVPIGPRFDVDEKEASHGE